MFVVNVDWFFLSHRLPLAQAALGAGADVVVVGTDTGYAAEIEKHGVRFFNIPIVRSETNVLTEAKTILRLSRIYRALRPDIIHHVTIKPILYGSMAARVTPGVAIVNAVSGRGSVFGNSGSPKMVRVIVDLLYRLAVARRSSRTIFQNVEDRDYFISRSWVRSEDAVLIRGSGVNTFEFQPHPEPHGVPIVLFASRLLREKGVGEFVAAARKLLAHGFPTRFVLVGRIDSENPSGISPAELQAWVREGVIEWWGNCDNMSQVYGQATLVVLPTYYKEGVPKALIEAAASGRAIVTTDVPGCRDIVRHGYNGLLVPPRDVESLADAIDTLLRSPSLRQQMGANGRKLCVEAFDVQIVQSQTLDVYRSLLDVSEPRHTNAEGA